MSYIVKNCPAFEQNSYKNRDWAIENACTDIDDRCCTKHNCIIKQVIEKANREMNYEEPDMCEILELFDIEEINK